jgi:hypothetical protein
MFNFFKILSINLLLVIILLEITSFLLIQILPISTRPVYTLQARHHYGDYNKYFGAWHIPKTKFLHKKTCFSANYSFNQLGSRDIDRDINAQNKNRTIVLGDSVVEGYGLNDDERISNILEKKTNIEHLNFGTSGHFGTTQYFLNYKYLSSKFDHNRVFIFFTITNDFEDDSLKFGKKNHKKRYRPYATKDNAGHYKIIYFNQGYLKKSLSFKDNIKNLLNNYTNFYHLLRYFYSAQKSKNPKSEKKKITSLKEYNSILYSENKIELDLMKANLINIKDLATKKNAKTYLIMIGHKKEYDQYFKNKKKYPKLLEDIRTFSMQNNIFFVDAFTNLEIKKNDLDEHFFKCDSHHSPHGSQIISKYLLKSIYEKN